LRKVSEFVEVAHRRNPREIKALIARGALYEIGDVVDSWHAKRGGVSAVTRHVKSKLQRLKPHSQPHDWHG
jgi:UDP-2,3-diacylglucosamine pyrophosphatase LpxH